MNSENYPLVDSSNYTEYLDELSDTINKLVEMTRSITTKHENQRAKEGKEPEWSEFDQCSKVAEEAFEVLKANYLEGQKKYGEENLDLLFSTLTQLHKAKLTPMEIKFSIGTCLSKFHKRGWLF